MRARACSAASGCAAHLRASVPSELAEAAPPPPAQPCGCRSPPASPGRRGAAAAALWAPPPPAGPAAHAPVSAHAGACLPGAAAVLAAPAEAGGARAPRFGGAAPGGGGGGEPDLSAVAAELRTVLSQFPAVRHAFAYGSGVFEQPGLYAAAGGAGAGAGARPMGGAPAPRPAPRPMLDFIFAVDSPVDWHHEVRLLLHTCCHRPRTQTDAAGGRARMRSGAR